MKAEELPELFQAELDADAYEALLRDLGELPGPLEVSVKQGATARVPEHERWTLEQGRRALEQGAARALQVRYEHNGVAWIDTILRPPAGYRLVRMRAPTL